MSMPIKKRTPSKSKRKKPGKGKKASVRKSPTKVSKNEKKLLKTLTKAFAYGVHHSMIDLERTTKVMSAATLAETKAVLRSLQSAEKLKATEQGRQAEPWAAGPTALKAKDAKFLFQGLKRKKSKGIDLKAFLDKCAEVVKVVAKNKGPTPGQIEEQKRKRMFAELDWSSYLEMIKAWPAHIQEQIRLDRTRAKRVTKEVHLEELSLKVPFSTDYLLDYTELHIEQHKKIALIGEPGTGKSTLFHAMANQEIKGFPTHLEVHHMEELEVSPDAKSLLDTVVHAHSFIIALRRCKVELLKRIEGTDGHNTPSAEVKAGLESNLRKVNDKLRETRSEFAEEEAAKMLRVLGFDDIAQQKSINSLSGGLRMRVALCAAFFVQADILLLDEPTNHLDFPSLLWLENKLRSYSKSFMVVCHDREILNNICQTTIRITDEKKLKYYNMGFEMYEKTRAKSEKKMANDVEKFLRRHRNIDFSSPLAVEAARKRKWLEQYSRKMVLRAGQFTFPPARPLKLDNHQIGMTDLAPEEASIIKVDNVRFSYDPVTLPFIFDTPINIDIKMGTRMGVMGPNGAGKSTFLKLLTGRLQPVDGKISSNKHATVAYFSQHHSAEMDLNSSAIQFMTESFPEEKTGLLRSHLAKVGITGEKTDTRMTDISQGLRSCVLFAKITYRCPNLLIMDEPTNFLDLETVDALIGATNKYKGSLLLVSHSRLFLKKCATTYLSICPGQFSIYNGLKECERATYSFIADLETGDKVRIGADNLAKHGSNKTRGGTSAEKVPEAMNDGAILI